MPMTKTLCLAGLLVLTGLFQTPAVLAGAYEQLQGMAGGSAPGVPDVPPPTRVDPEPADNGSSGGTDNSGATGGGIW